jgi:hypothetical protein
MKRGNGSLKTYVLCLFVAASVVVGCNSAAGPPANGGGNNAPSLAHHADAVTTTYKVDAIQGFGNFHGTYSPTPCWTVSPSPLPQYWSTDKVSVTYAGGGCSTRSITITYESGYSEDVQPCYYKIHYPVGGPFAYSTQDEGVVECSVATEPPSKNWDEELIYGPFDTPHSRAHTH